MYATTGNAINIVTNGSGTGIEKGDHIYYGTKTDAYVYKESGDGDGTDPYWRVLDASKDNAGDSKAMFVMAESLWGTGGTSGNVYFKHSDPYSHAWQGSDAQGWCGTFRDAVFSSNEKSAIKNVSKHDDAEILYTFGWDESSLSNEKVFFLSVKEVYDYISQTEGDALKAKYNGTDRDWWLRSPHNSANNAGVVANGFVDFDNVNTEYAARPAFNIDLESVILTSAAEGGKNPGTRGDGTLNSVDSGEVSKWKLTVLDSSRNGFTASAPKADCTAPEGYTSWTVPVTYSGAKSGLETEHVSAILTDSDGNALYYGHIATNSAGGTKDLTIPTGLPKGTYTLNVFSEQVNGDKKTDYASPLKTITLTVTEADTPIAVTGVSVAPTEVTLKPDATKKLTATVKPDNASNKEVTWESDDENIAAVSDDGTVTAKAEGETTITVKTVDGNKTATCKVIVKKDAPVVETCNISFDANGGKGEMDDQTVDKGVKTKLKENAFTRDGYSFANWNTQADGKGKSYDDKDYITAEKDITLYAQWEKGNIRPRPRKHDDDESSSSEEATKPAVVNPDTVEGYFAVNGQLLPGVTMGKTKQGVAAQAVFNANRPVGWQEAFTFNMAINGKVDYTLKNGVLTIIIPKEYQKAGRTFAIMALDKNGKAWTFADTDTNPATVTATINVEGYAFALIYKD